MISEAWSESYKVTSYLVNLRGQAGLYAMLNLIQDAGWQHAINLGIQLPRHQSWVFTRQKLMMQKWPAWKQTVTIKTWLRPPGPNPFLLRDYEIFVDDQKIGECTSTFTAFDTQSRKMVALEWSEKNVFWRTQNLLSNHPAKILVAVGAEELAQFEVRNSDIDLNNHVNNTKYAQWVLDALPIEMLKGGVDLYGYEVNFLAETKKGDKISLQKSAQSLEQASAQVPIPDGASLVHFQGIRVSDNKAVFTAHLITSPL